MFILIECILFILFLFCDFIFLKYLSIIVCFFYAIYQRKEYCLFFVILVADYILLWSQYYFWGIFLFMIVQCVYHYMMNGSRVFYMFLFMFFSFSYIVLAMTYMIMTILNMIIAIQKKHWLLVTIILLACCDVCVVLQYVLSKNIPLIWMFYLPSQVYYVKKAPSIKMEPL